MHDQAGTDEQRYDLVVTPGAGTAPIQAFGCTDVLITCGWVDDVCGEYNYGA
ncbi:MAG: hypothetical protein JSU63_16200 [Phycisphaerales bacterium]|nr:MAG: hypothetical protein JSU63_16200 [Phycisphaerales bacterium]